MQEAKDQLLKAKILSNGFTPANEGFDVFREGYNSLGGKLFDNHGAQAKNNYNNNMFLSHLLQTFVKFKSMRRTVFEKYSHAHNLIHTEASILLTIKIL